MDSACVTCSTPARFKLCGSPPALHIAPEKSGAGFGEHPFCCTAVRPPFRTAVTGRGHRPRPVSLFGAIGTIAVTITPLEQPVSTLDPEDALAGPLYLLAGMLVFVPLVDFILTVPPAEWTNARWRFDAVGLLSGYTLLPVLGFAVALVVSAIRKQYSLQRGLVIGCLTMAAIILVLSISFLQDMADARAYVTSDAMPAFSSATTRAIIKLLLTSISLAYLGWRARRMIPAPVRHKTPKPVHVISK
jgi:hypothetical protein